ncbi:restriction endonuclease subunit S [Turicibacter bilis]|uniref:Restriction endonuclease subunit S n=1 Tax=Turicibacter bilis TaxID=2735723 RepID=A0ABY5JLE2_9FIRM|nr:restriction endonuclease subunit S [Turicibacter bilis]MBS3199832.1 restriction endonuclease subunit S [Turicibacter bilis]UUF06701.1 restriction endonuclease subunit S [Turicibacter bilis]
MCFNYISLKELVNSANTGADAIKRAPIVEEDTGLRCIRIGDISNNRPFNEWGFTRAEDTVINKFLLKKDDILVARTGNTIGVVKYIDKDLNSLYNNGLIRLKVNQNICPKYIYYNLISNNFKQYIYGISAGTSTQPNMKINHMLDYKVMDIPYNEQKAIVDILSSLDDKIELNNQMNETLEEMAQALFRRWFIDFEFPNEEGQPYKSSGGEMVESELGMIPKGWKVKKIQDVSVSANTGADAIRRAPIVEHDTGIKCVRVGDFTNKRNYDAWGFCQITEEDYKKFQLKENDILITRTASIGLIKFVLEDINAVFNNGIIRLRVFDEIAMYVNATLNSVDFTNHINKITGETSTRPNMKVNYVLNYKFVVPNEKINNHFINIYSKILRKIDYISKENQQLALIRDTLLPKLMSGEIRVSDVES